MYHFEGHVRRDGYYISRDVTRRDGSYILRDVSHAAVVTIIEDHIVRHDGVWTDMSPMSPRLRDKRVCITRLDMHHCT